MIGHGKRNKSSTRSRMKDLSRWDARSSAVKTRVGTNRLVLFQIGGMTVQDTKIQKKRKQFGMLHIYIFSNRSRISAILYRSNRASTLGYLLSTGITFCDQVHDHAPDIAGVAQCVCIKGDNDVKGEALIVSLYASCLRVRKGEWRRRSLEAIERQPFVHTMSRVPTQLGVSHSV